MPFCDRPVSQWRNDTNTDKQGSKKIGHAIAVNQRIIAHIFFFAVILLFSNKSANFNVLAKLMGIQNIISAIYKLAPESISRILINELEHKRLAIDTQIYLYNSMLQEPQYNGQYVVYMLRMAHWFKRRNIVPIFVFDNQSRTLQCKKQVLSERRHRKRHFIETQLKTSETLVLMQCIKTCLHHLQVFLQYAPLHCDSDATNDVAALHASLEDAVASFLPFQLIQTHLNRFLQPLLQPHSLATSKSIFFKHIADRCIFSSNCEQWLQVQIGSTDVENIDRLLHNWRDTLQSKLRQEEQFYRINYSSTKAEVSECGINFTFVALVADDYTQWSEIQLRDTVNEMWQSIYNFRKQYAKWAALTQTATQCQILQLDIALPVLLYKHKEIQRHRGIVAPNFNIVQEFEIQMQLQCLLCVETQPSTIVSTSEPSMAAQTINCNELDLAVREQTLTTSADITPPFLPTESTTLPMLNDISPIAQSNESQMLFDFPLNKDSIERHITLWHQMQQQISDTDTGHDAVKRKIKSDLENLVEMHGIANVDYETHSWLSGGVHSKVVRLPLLHGAKKCLEKQYNLLLESLMHLGTIDAIVHHLTKQSTSLSKQTVRISFDQVNIVKEALEAHGEIVIDARHEAEAMCVQLCCAGLADYVVTDDSDAIAFGGRNILRKIHLNDCAAGSEVFGEHIDCFKLCSALRISADQLVDWCVLCGSDFTFQNGHVGSSGSKSNPIAILKSIRNQQLVFNNICDQEMINAKEIFKNNVAQIDKLALELMLENARLNAAQLAPSERRQRLFIILSRLDCLDYALPYVQVVYDDDSTSKEDLLTRSSSVSPKTSGT